MARSLVTKTAGGCRLSGYTSDMVFLRRGQTEVASATRCDKQGGCWHDGNAPRCAEAAIHPTYGAALMALTVGNPATASALTAMLRGEP